MRKFIGSLFLCLVVASLFYYGIVGFKGRALAKNSIANQVATPILPNMKLPFDKALTGSTDKKVTYSGGPHARSNAPTSCGILSSTDVASGIDIATYQKDTAGNFTTAQDFPVLAVGSGIIRYANYFDSQLRSVVIIEFGDMGLGDGRHFGIEYWHMNSIPVNIRPGKSVLQGALIGGSGWSPYTDSNGNSQKAYHLHIEAVSGTDADFTSANLTPYTPINPYPIKGISFDGYRPWQITRVSDSVVYNYEGTLTKGAYKSIQSTFGAATQTSYPGCASVLVKTTIADTTKDPTSVYSIADSSASASALASTNKLNTTKSWQFVTSQNVDFGSSLMSVASVSPTENWAVGMHNTASGLRTLVEYWDAINYQWTVDTSVDYSGSLNGISSDGKGGVWAVGNDSAVPLLLHHDAVGWHSIPVPTTVSAAGFTAVKALSNKDIWIAGYQAASWGIVLHYVNGVWNSYTFNTPYMYVGSMSGISGGLNDIWVTGLVTIGMQQQAGVFYWNGSTWSQEFVPIGTPQQTPNSPTGILAFSSTNVWLLVRSYVTAYVLHWDGTQWTSVYKSTASSGFMSNYSYLAGFAASSPHNIFAVGTFWDTAAHPLVLHFNGTTWSQISAPDAPQGPNNGFDAVTTVSDGSAWAVGMYGYSGYSFVERYS